MRTRVRIVRVVPEQALRWVIEAIGHSSRITSMRRLALGGWHVDHAIDVLDAGGHTHQLVLRRWARPGWEIDDPDYTVAREVRVLELLGATPVPAPVTVAADPDGAYCDVPALLLTRLPGRPPRPADRHNPEFCAALATALAHIHDVDRPAADRPEPYRLYHERDAATLPSWMPGTAVWRAAIAATREAPPTAAMAFIHRDYHPENTLWSRRRLTGVVDWPQASWGPPGLDVGHMRWNLVADHGQVIADRFLDAYRAITGRALDDQPYWDLVSLFDLLLDGDGPGDVELVDLHRFEAYAQSVLAAHP